MTDNERRLRNSLKNALARIDTLTRLLEEKGQSSTNALIKTYRLEPMTPAEHHDERLAFAAKCDGEDDGEDDGGDAAPACPACHGPSFPLGVLGNLAHYRCRNCGADYSHACGEGEE